MKSFSQGEFWYYRTKPKDDELFSSWVVRLSSGLAIRLQTFSTRILKVHAGYWTGDIDRNPNRSALAILSNKAYVSIERVYDTCLVSFTGRLWERYHHGPLAWITTVGRHGRRRYAYGQQYCRLCLAEDSEPYFRKSWRLAFNVACIKHGIYLRDCCSYCKNPVQFHTGDFGIALIPPSCVISSCSICQGDLSHLGLQPDIKAPAELLLFQAALNRCLSQGFGNIHASANNYSHLFFSGFRRLVHICCSQSRLRRIMVDLMQKQGLLGLSFRYHGSYLFESMRVGDRALAMSCAHALLFNWPHGLISLGKQFRVSSSYLLDYRRTLPYWLESEIKWYLDDRDYAPAPEEFEAVERYLLSHELPINQSNINLLLGVSAISAMHKLKRQRWNPRGISNTD